MNKMVPVFRSSRTEPIERRRRRFEDAWMTEVLPIRLIRKAPWVTIDPWLSVCKGGLAIISLPVGRPFRAEHTLGTPPRALPWARLFPAFQAGPRLERSARGEPLKDCVDCKMPLACSFTQDRIERLRSTPASSPEAVKEFNG